MFRLILTRARTLSIGQRNMTSLEKIAKYYDIPEVESTPSLWTKLKSRFILSHVLPNFVSNNVTEYETNAGAIEDGCAQAYTFFREAIQEKNAAAIAMLCREPLASSVVKNYIEHRACELTLKSVRRAVLVRPSIFVTLEVRSTPSATIAIDEEQRPGVFITMLGYVWYNIRLAPGLELDPNSNPRMELLSRILSPQTEVGKIHQAVDVAVEGVESYNDREFESWSVLRMCRALTVENSPWKLDGIMFRPNLREIRTHTSHRLLMGDMEPPQAPPNSKQK